jgi:hypothetical protein
MDTATGPAESAPEDAPEDESPTGEHEGRKPTSVRSSSEVADTVMATYARLARRGKTPPA